MTNLQQNKRNVHSRGGFSLVEVVLALTVVVIGLVAVLGMLVSGLHSSRAAADNCIPAMIAQDIFSQIRAEYRSYNFGNPGTGQDLSTVTSELPLYYDNSGVLTNLLASTVVASPYFRVNITYADPPSTVMPMTRDSMVIARVQVLWPDISPARTNEFVSQIVKMR